MKIMTILGTRPEIIRLSGVIRQLDDYADHILVNTGQNHDPRLNSIFFEELGVRKPDVHMGVSATSFGAQIGQIIEKGEELFLKHRPDRLLILGDTNSGICAMVAKRLGIPVYHMEAGNRCFDDRVPEEVNRRIIDHSSTVLMPYTERSRSNLLKEGFPSDRIFVTGNPIKEVIDFYAKQIDLSNVLDEIGVEQGKYFLVTMHRAENVDLEIRLRNLVEALSKLNAKWGYPVICSVHPRTKSKMNKFGIDPEGARVRFLEPFGFFDFIKLERSAFCLLSDSGTVQEEACIFGVPNVTIRDVTERPETIECGSNILSGADPDRILRTVEMVTKERPQWQTPPEYLKNGVADTVCRIVLSYRIPDLSELLWHTS